MAIRRDWMRYYTYLNRRYGLGLEASYIDSTTTAKRSYMTVQQIESAKADIQNRIYKGESPNSRRVDRSIRPLIEYSATSPFGRALTAAFGRVCVAPSVGTDSPCGRGFTSFTACAQVHRPGASHLLLQHRPMVQ